MRLLVCGDRFWSDRKYIYDVLNLKSTYFARIGDPIEYLIEGEASGADEMAGDWADVKGILALPREPWVKVRPYKWYSDTINKGWVRGFPALWQKYGPKAGPIRNKEMLDVGKPTYGIAFHNDLEHSSGTKSMVNMLRKAGIKVEIHAPDALAAQSDLGFNYE